jgi:hypothetical protein
MWFFAAPHAYNQCLTKILGYALLYLLHWLKSISYLILAFLGPIQEVWMEWQRFDLAKRRNQ